MKLRGIHRATFALALLSLLGFAGLGQTKEKAEDHKEHSKMMQACAKACSDCQRMCDSCATHCSHLLAEGKKAHLTTLASCQDCSTICSAASKIVARGGPFSNIICTACVECCANCAKECEKFPDDKHMTACAKECRKCEKSCKEMLAHGK